MSRERRADRRARLLSITTRGRRVRRAVQADIQAREETLLSRLSSVRRTAFLGALATLSEVPPDELLDD